jgi:hypothetical protein
LDVNMRHVASIPEDTAFAKSVRIRKAVVECDPNSPAAAELRGLARSAESWVVKSSGRPTFFTGYEARANSRSCALERNTHAAGEIKQTTTVNAGAASD